MSIIRIESLNMLGREISSCIPELRGRVCAGVATGTQRLSYPSLGINATSFKPYYYQQMEEQELGPSGVLFSLGRVEAEVTLTLSAETSNLRYALEQRILDTVFYADINRPGIKIFQVPECHDAVVVFELMRTQWEDEKAFDKKYASVMDLMLQIPILSEQRDMPQMSNINLSVEESLGQPFDPDAPLPPDTVTATHDGVTSFNN